MRGGRAAVLGPSPHLFPRASRVYVLLHRHTAEGAEGRRQCVVYERFINPDCMNQNADPGPPNRDARDAPNENCGPFWFGASKYLCVL